MVQEKQEFEEEKQEFEQKTYQPQIQTSYEEAQDGSQCKEK